MDVAGLVHSFFTSAGPGGVVIVLVISLACTVYYLLTRWILQGGSGKTLQKKGQ